MKTLGITLVALTFIPLRAAACLITLEENLTASGAAGALNTVKSALTSKGYQIKPGELFNGTPESGVITYAEPNRLETGYIQVEFFQMHEKTPKNLFYIKKEVKRPLRDEPDSEPLKEVINLIPACETLHSTPIRTLSSTYP